MDDHRVKQRYGVQGVFHRQRGKKNQYKGRLEGRVRVSEVLTKEQRKKSASARSPKFLLTGREKVTLTKRECRFGQRWGSKLFIRKGSMENKASRASGGRKGKRFLFHMGGTNKEG